MANVNASIKTRCSSYKVIKIKYGYSSNFFLNTLSN